MHDRTKKVLSDLKAMEHGISLPQYALLGHEMNSRAKLPDIPVTEEEAIRVFQQWFSIRGAS